MSVTGTMDSCIQKEPTRMGRKTVPGSITMMADGYGPKEPTRTESSTPTEPSETNFIA